MEFSCIDFTVFFIEIGILSQIYKKTKEKKY